MPRRKPIPVARRQFAQRPGLPFQARMQRNPGRMARQATAQARNPMAGCAEARPNARGARQQNFLPEDFVSRGKKASTRPVGMKAEWRQSFWFQIPFLGNLVDLLRSLVYPQEHLRVMKRGYVGTGIGSIAKDRLAARIEQRRQEKQASRQRAIVQRNRAPGIAGKITRRQARGTQNYPRQKTA